MTQQLMLEPLGIITEPNKLGQIPAGGLSSAINVAIRRPGCIESMAGFSTFTAFTSDAGTTAAFVITPPGSAMLVIFNRTAGWFYQWYNQTTGGLLGTSTALSLTLGGGAYPQSIPLNVQPGFSYVIHGKQLFVNLYSTVIVWDTYEPTTLAERTPRPAGLFPPQMSAPQTIFGTIGTAIPSERYANYTAIYKRQVGDTLLVSAPGPAVSGYNSPSGTASNVEVIVRFNEFVKAGDILELYKTPSKPTGPAVATAHQTGEEAGPEYRKATSVVLTAANITAGFVTIVDKTPDENLGEALYTNQAIGSVGAAAYPPPALRFMTSHKGYVFGFGTTSPPSISLRPTGAWNGIFQAAADAQAGFGGKVLTGCTWSAGGPPTVVTVSPTSQLGFIKIGTGASAGGGGSSFNSNVTAVGASTFTIAGAAAVSGAAATVNISDLLEIDGGIQFNEKWYFTPATVSFNDSLMLIAPALKLPPNKNAEFTSQPTDGFTVRKKLLSDARTTFTVKSSGAQNWDPDVAPWTAVTGTPATIEAKPRAMVWSDQNQPESWPFVNADTFARGQPCAFASTRDCIVAFYTDAIWRISGTGGTAKDGYDWRADPIVTGVTVQGSQAVCVLHDVVYAMTSEGLIAIDGSSVRNISKGRIHDQLACPPWSDAAYTIGTACFLIADEETNEILMREPSATATVMWAYNVATDTFVQRTAFVGAWGPTHGDYSRFLRGPVVVGKDLDGEWRLACYGTSGTLNAAFTYQPVYADNPFAQRQWQSVDLVAEPTVNGNYFFVQCNGVATSTGGGRALTNGRVSFEVPRNAPAIGNTMGITVFVDGNAGVTRILGVALNYRDATDRRRKR